jgi:hypothetical protein
MVTEKRGMLFPICALMAMALAFSAEAQLLTMPAREQMLGLLERGALHRDQVDWRKLRRDLANTQDPKQQRALLIDAIQRATAGHGRWLSVDEANDRSKRSSAGQQNPMSSSAAGDASTTVRLDARLGLIDVGPYLADRGLSQAQQVAHGRQWALNLQTAIRQQDDGSRCGWMVDLRLNSGGNMWPMLLGIGPLLHESADESEPVGYFNDGRDEQPWRYRNGSVGVSDQVYFGLGTATYVLKRPGSPVAVLQSGRTASSDEAIALALRGRDNSRSFGFPTAGYSTGNRPITLVDGSLLLLTGTVMKDRNRMGDGARIVPDTPSTDDVDIMRSAQQWLLAQPACTGKREGATAPPPINVSR